MKTKRAPRAQSSKTKPAPDSMSGDGIVHEPVGKHVGEILRQAREERKVTIEMIADELMIRRFYLDALEKGAFQDLPERVYATGFVKNYANYLGLDAKALIEQFKRDAYGTRYGSAYQVALNMPEPVAHSAVPGRSVMVTAVIALVVIIAGVIWLTRQDKPVLDAIPEPSPVQESAAPDIVDTPVSSEANRTNSAYANTDLTNNDNTANENIGGFVGAVQNDGALDASRTSDNGVANSAPLGSEISNTESQNAGAVQTSVNETAASAADSAATSSATPSGAPAINVTNHRVLEAMQASWVEVRDDRNTILFTSILKAGQILPLPDGVRLSVTAGNAGGLRLLIDGQPQPVFGQLNEVKRNMMIAPRPLDRH